MKKFKIGALMVAICLSMSSCIVINAGSGSKCDSEKVKNGTIDIVEFSKIEVSADELIYIPADYNKVEYSVCDDAVDKLNIKVKNGKLHVGINGGRNNHILKVVVYGNTPLTYVSASGATDFICKGELVTDGLAIDCSGASEFQLDGKITATKIKADCSGASQLSLKNVECIKLSVDCSGASSVYLKGKCVDANYDASGASDIAAYGIIAQNVYADASGASDIECFVAESGSISRSSSGASSVKVKRN